MNTQYNIKKELDDIETSRINQHVQPYYAWIRHIVSLSVVCLTGLIALQESYLPSSPKLPILLVVCWLGLLSSILLGVLALQNEYKQHLASARDLREKRRVHGDVKMAQEVVQKGHGVASPKSHHFFVFGMTASFFLSLSSLCVFSIVNLLTTSA